MDIRRPAPPRAALAWLAALMLGLAAAAAHADDDPPGRIGRIAETQGRVWLYDRDDAGTWVEATRNRPLTRGDRLSTDPGARAEVDIGSSTLRLDGATEVEVLRLDDRRIELQLHAGGLALRVRSREVADEIELATGEVRLHPLRPGHFRVERRDDRTWAGAWRGDLRVDDAEDPFSVDAGRRVELWREGGRRVLRHAWTPLPDDDFAAWVLAEDRQDERRAASQPYVSPEMTGAADLDRYGRWQSDPDHGVLWWPTAVAVDWAPYRYGRWAWIAPWGWTWVDDAPWGFAPSHYGRWVSIGGRWAWSPGAYVARPVYAPALVAWVGGPHFSVSIGVGTPVLPAVGWVPLSPYDTFVPWYRGSPRYVERINLPPPGRVRPPRQVPTGPIMYGNQGVPGAVTVVPRDVLQQRQPVQRAVVGMPVPAESLQRVAPPAVTDLRSGRAPGAGAPSQVLPEPGGARRAPLERERTQAPPSPQRAPGAELPPPRPPVAQGPLAPPVQAVPQAPQAPHSPPVVDLRTARPPPPAAAVPDARPDARSGAPAAAAPPAARVVPAPAQRPEPAAVPVPPAPMAPAVRVAPFQVAPVQTPPSVAVRPPPQREAPRDGAGEAPRDGRDGRDARDARDEARRGPPESRPGSSGREQLR